MNTLNIDIETYSSVDLKKSGMYKYAASEDFQILMMAYSFDDGPVKCIPILDITDKLTIGEERVRVNFNVSGDSVVDQIKRKTAELIDLCESLRAEGKDGRAISLAQTEYESAAHWAVKAATSESRP